ncbi:hypothetical protein Bca52824_013774 [Brassica carinata]|uniref:RNA helicase n=1 Tax=Brassica carinata TaxID=52824 RepID=A0A8X7VZY7_BRACI|nr:hypothetical protein Bca52824_013774 [Brassica carinata]
MAGKKQQLPVSGEPLTDVESPMTYTITKKKKKSKKNKHSEKDEEVEVLQEVTDGEELSNKEKKKKKRKREEKEKEADKVAEKVKSVEEAKLPENVVDFCKTFQIPSSIQSHSYGSSKRHQISAIRSGVPPGRLRDLTESNELMLSLWVLDEADRMLDMGFEEPVRFILSKTNKVRQTVLFSATWPMVDVHKLAQEFMELNPVKVVIGSVDLAAIHDVMQIVEVRSLSDITPREGNVLSRILKNMSMVLLENYHKFQKNRVLVFALYKVEADCLERCLQTRKLYLHENKAQNERTRSCPLLVATDVAARGLDIPNVEVVINYSFPLTTEGYVHRIGRTGRAAIRDVTSRFIVVCVHIEITSFAFILAFDLVIVLRKNENLSVLSSRDRKSTIELKEIEFFVVFN